MKLECRTNIWAASRKMRHRTTMPGGWFRMPGESAAQPQRPLPNSFQTRVGEVLGTPRRAGRYFDKTLRAGRAGFYSSPLRTSKTDTKTGASRDICLITGTKTRGFAISVSNRETDPEVAFHNYQNVA